MPHHALVHGFSTLEAGPMQGAAGGPATSERRALVESLGFDAARMTVAGAVHGAEVARIDEPLGVVPGVDALVTAVPGLPLLLTYADCHAVVLFDPARRALALCHAGWRGSAAGVLAAAVSVLGREYGSRPGDLVAAFGPGICGRCYQVGDEVAARFDSRFSSADGPGHRRLDLAAANRAALEAAGVRAAAIAGPEWCTFEDPGLASHRRDADGRRCAAVAGLR